MEPPEFRVEQLVLLVLPVRAGFVAEEDPTTEGADRVNATELAALERTAAGVGVKRWLLKIAHERRQLHCRDVETMPELVEPATATGQLAARASLVDLRLQVDVDAIHGVAH